MKQLTDEEIIKALECCSTRAGIECEDCPVFNINGDVYCTDLHRLTIEVIKQQKAEIEKLKKEKEELQKFIERIG